MKYSALLLFVCSCMYPIVLPPRLTSGSYPLCCAKETLIEAFSLPQKYLTQSDSLTLVLTDTLTGNQTIYLRGKDWCWYKVLQYSVLCPISFVRRYPNDSLVVWFSIAQGYVITQSYRVYANMIIAPY